MNIKIGEVVLSNVNITDSGDLLGLNFVSPMNLAQLDELFSPATYPEFRIVNDEGEAISVYRNRKVITLRVDACDEGNVVNVAMQVTPSEIEEVELLTNQVNDQNEAIVAQQTKIDEQDSVIAAQAETISAQSEQIAEQEAEIEDLKSSVVETQTNLTATQEELTTTKAALGEAQTALAEAQETNNMLMECVLEMSEVVYA